MTMPIAMNTITIKQAPFAEKLRLIAGAGFSGVGLWMAEVEEYLKESKAKPINELLEELRLTPVEMHSFHEWQYLSGSERRQFFAEAKDFFTRFRKLGIECPVAAIATYERMGKIADAVRDFRDLCRLADDFDARVMFEFVGWSKQFHDLKRSWEVVGEADCANGGLLIDTFHFVKAGSTIAQLKQISMDKVFLVHLSDTKPLSLGFKDQSRRFRFHPGEGEAPLKEIVECFVDGGYKGFYCVELFNETYWAEDPESVVMKSKKSLDALFEFVASARLKSKCID